MGLKKPKQELYEQLKQEQLEMNRIEQLINEADKNRIPEVDLRLHGCDHNPYDLDFLGREKRLDLMVDIYQCQCCGEQVEKLRPFDESCMM